jgi:PIN domain nuclease of toxin-antitoxin system
MIGSAQQDFMRGASTPLPRATRHRLAPRIKSSTFHRLIAAQCLRHNLPLISIDTIFDAYGVRRVW